MKRLVLFFRLWATRYFYRPRIGKLSANIRLTRLFVFASALTVGIITFTQEKGIALPNITLSQDDRVGQINGDQSFSVLDKQLDGKLAENIESEVQASKSKRYEVSVISSRTLNNHVLVKQIDIRQKKLDKLQEKYKASEKTLSTITQASTSKSTDSEFSEYELAVENKLNRVGNSLYKSYSQQRLDGAALVEIQIGRDGNLLNVQIVESSGNQLIDDLCLETVQKASPFVHFYKDMQEDSITMQRILRVTP